MKKKTLILIGLCVFGLYIEEAQAVNATSTPYPASIPIDKWEIADPPQGYEKINLHGTLMFGISPNAVVAGSNENSVYIGFNQDFGNVNISIYNGAGLVVYSTVVNTNVQTVVIIPFTAANTGSYTVFLENATGYAEGDFDHD